MNVHHPSRMAIVAAVCMTAIGCQAPDDDQTSVIDGMVVEVDDDLVYFLWDGGRQRVQQPAALSEADLVDLGLEIGEAAPTLLTVGTETTRFVVHPADGPAARLYLVQADTLHEVEIVKASEDAVADRRDLEDVVIDRVQIP